MGLLSRLAKIGSGIVRQTLSPNSVAESEVVESEPSNETSTSPVREEEISVSPPTKADAASVGEESSRSNSNEAGEATRKGSNVQATQRDGHRRSL